MKKQKALVIGSYGCGNRGDDAILQAIVEYFPEIEISAFCGKEDDIDFLNINKVKCRLNEGFSIKILLLMIIDSINILSKVLSSDILIYGGGSLIHDLTWYNLPFMYFWQLIANIFRKKVYYFCIGIGPMNTERGKKLSKTFLSKATHVYPRDHRGKEICEKLELTNYTQVYDAAFLVQEKNRYQLKTLKDNGLKEKEYICVTSSEWFGSSNFWNKENMDFEQQVINLARVLTKVIDKYEKPLVFVPTVKLDYNLALKLEKIINSDKFIIISPMYNTSQMAEIIENAYFLIGTRMHSIIFAARQTVPFIAMIYDQKVSELMSLLEMDEYSFDLNGLTEEILFNKIDQLMSNYNAIEKKLDKKRQLFRNTILQECVNKIKG